MEAQPKDFISCLAARDDSWVGVDCIRVLVFFVFHDDGVGEIMNV